ncbi:hypothetical protein DVH05_004428 [Phytophthora capsici]|nr:hypothetical protein DVH05_015121 [Phytophthora capsici]KAG1688018.1 hypothetical protein DVH05_004428 [Phytophthora capsici]
MGNTCPEDVCARVLEAAKEGENWRLVAAHNRVVVETAWAWVRRARRLNDFTAPAGKRGGAHNRKLHDEHLDFLEDRLSENCYLTLEQMKEMLLDHFDVNVDAETVRANLDALCFTVKKGYRDNNYRTTVENKAKRQEFAMKVLQYVAADTKILYLDETNFNL